MRITFDEEKRLKTLAERGLDFKDALTVFTGFYHDKLDDRFDYGEDRHIAIGQLEENIVVLVWTEREDSRRIISMRKADRDERKDYDEQKRLDRSG